MLLVGRPLKATHLLLVAEQRILKRLGSTSISLQNLSVAASRREQVRVPRQSTDSTRVPRHGSDALALDRIPNLNNPLSRSDREERSSAHPLDRRD